MSHNFHVQKRKDKFTKLAKQQGYRSRAAYKLIELNKQHHFLSTARAAIDLCAAPGGWLQVMSKYMPVSSMILGVDILPIKPLPKVISFVQDITTQECRQKLRQQTQGWPIDLVVHDGAPNGGGGASWVKDVYLQNELVLHSVKLATEFLREGGTFVTKIFRSDDYMAIIWVLKQFFEKVEVTKPKSSREHASEVFAVCTRFLAPAKTDPRIFDPNVVFKLHQEQSETNKVVNVLKMKPTTRANRSGYDDSEALTTYRSAPISQLFAASNPSSVLGQVTEVTWDMDNETTQRVANDPSTTDELRECLKDLKVLNKGDFSRILRWHKKLFDVFDRERRQEAGEYDVDEEELEELTPEQLIANQEAALDAELDALRTRLEHRKVTLKRKLHEKKMKELQRLAVNAHNLAERMPTNDDDDDSMFHLSMFKDQKLLRQFHKMQVESGDGEGEQIDLDRFKRIISTQLSALGDEDLDELEEKIRGEGNGLTDEEWDALPYQEQRERLITAMYSSFKDRHGVVTKRDKKAQAKIGADQGRSIAAKDGDDLNLNDEDDDADIDDEDKVRKNVIKASRDAKKQLNKGSSLAEVQQYLKESKKTADLLQTNNKDTELDQASRWFSQDIFADVDLHNDQERALYAKHQQQLKDLDVKHALLKRRRAEYLAKKRAAANDDDSDDDDEEIRQASVKRARAAAVFQDNGSSDDFTDSDDSDRENFGSAHGGAGRWKGSAEDKQKDYQIKLDRETKAQEYAYKLAQMNKADVQIAPAEPDQEAVSEYSDDSDSRAEILALGQKMLRKRTRNQLIESSYNKYAWNDRDDLPEWFAEDEKAHNSPQLPITKAEVLAVKAQLKAIDARPIHKLAESKARKKRREVRTLERQKIQADQILGQEGISSGEKLKQLQKLQGRKKKTEKLQKEYILTTSGGKMHGAKNHNSKKGKTWTIRVDSRMKKDKMGARRAEWRKKHHRK